MRRGGSIGGLLLICSCLVVSQVNGEIDAVHTNQFHVRTVRDVNSAEGHLIANLHGFDYIGPVAGSKRDHHFIHNELPHAAATRSKRHENKLMSHSLVESAEQQSGYKREKRGFRYQTYTVKKRGTAAQKESARDMYKLDKAPTDPLYEKEWFLKNNGQAGGVKDLDLNVEAAWAQGATGKGITTAIMDDGIDYMHPDIFDNYNAEASWDFSSNDPYPYPRYTDDWFNSHGTRCAGEIVAARDNDVCGVGVAYKSKVAGLRMLDQPYMTDLIEANSMSHRPDLVDIYSASWGPTDDGKTVDGPRNLTMRAILQGVNDGRNGKGSIYVWASGDGGPQDDCNCDGYAASMWTISINSATNDGQTASYDESCSSTLASTFSNGKGFFDAGVATTDLYGKCTLKHSGTSAAAPEAAGVFALALETNNELTWRDLQHLVVLTSKRNHLFDPHKVHNWKTNGAGLEFNHLFGFGVLDAGALVDLARRWKPLPERVHCVVGSARTPYRFTKDRPLMIDLNADSCVGTKEEVNYLEHVQAFISVNSTRRGALVFYLESPMGTKTMILSERPNDDDSTHGFVHWPFMTTHTWAENPRGRWRLIGQLTRDGEEAVLTEWTLVLHGTKLDTYSNQAVLKRDSKLDVVKRLHLGRGFAH